jgi:hypothetical protein
LDFIPLGISNFILYIIISESLKKKNVIKMIVNIPILKLPKPAIMLFNNSVI